LERGHAHGEKLFLQNVWWPMFSHFDHLHPEYEVLDWRGYCNELNRETFLQSLGFQVVSIPYDDIKDRPDLTTSLLRMLLSKYTPIRGEKLQLLEKEILRLAYSLNGTIRPIDVVNHLNINRRTATRHIRALCDKGKLHAMSDGHLIKICRYELTRVHTDTLDFY
jgi:hypothetical protein